MTDAPDVTIIEGSLSPVPPALPAAVLWDMDGTLVDTEPTWHEAEYALIGEFGGTWTEADAVGLTGTAIPDAALVLQRHGVRLSVDEIVRRLLDHVVRRVAEGGVDWMPGARELLASLRERGVPTALVTMSFTPLAEAVLALLPRGSFDAVITGDAVRRSKPHPEPYLLAAARLGVEPRRAVAIEDSPPGIASAQAAGVPVVAVPREMPVPPAPERVVLPGLQGLDPYTLEALASSVRARLG